MNLQASKVPTEFLKNLPEGMKLLIRGGQEFLVVERVESSSGESLMSDQVRIHGEPSIRLNVTIAGERGQMFVDSFWGSHAKLFSFLPNAVGSDTVVEAYAPDGSSLLEPYACDMEGCDSDQGIALHLMNGQGTVRVCARLGCPGHRLELAALADPVVDTVSSINFFGAGSIDDDLFGGAL